MLTGPMRSALERRCVDLERAAAIAGPEEDLENLIAGLVARYATGKTGEASAAIRIEWYMDVLSHLPAWAVKEAIRRWRRGECGAHNYDFAPSEPVLRAVAESIVMATKGQVTSLRRLLAAQPVEELDEETRALNRARLAKAMDDLVAELKEKNRQVTEDERKHTAQKRKDLYDAMEKAAAERRQRMENINGGRDEQAEGAGAHGVDSNEQCGDSRDI